MAVLFIGDNWLMASAIVGFLRACELSGKDWEGWIKGRKLEVPDSVWQEMGSILGEALFKEACLKSSVENYIRDLKSSKNKNKNKNPYDVFVLSLIGDFHNNSVLTNPSSIKSNSSIQELENWLKGEAIELLESEEEFKNQLKDKIKKAVEEALGKLKGESENAPLCFFCRERKTYKYKNKWRTFDVVHFTPLSASPETIANFFYNGKNTMYLCIDCEKLLFFSSLAYTKVGENYTFAYLPEENLKAIYDANNVLIKEKKITKNFIRHILKRKVEYSYKNVYIVEIQKIGQAKANIHVFTFDNRLLPALYEYLVGYPQGFFGEIFDIFLDYITSGKSLYEMVNYILLGFFFDKNKKYSESSFTQRLINLGKSFKFLPNKLTYFIMFQEYLTSEEGKDMGEKQISWAYAEGKKLYEKLVRKYGEKNVKKRVQTLSYRILEAVRRKDTDVFVQSIIRAYLELETEVPALFKEALVDKNFNRIAYAFLIGLNGGRTDGGKSEGEVGEALGEE
ncbi:MAG: type I-B CRISPR-associated protein Cas8b1/Cst1 [Acidobacteria bacterium]|nr:MAG: type I-B CRISPR-associated protein Cas8b1/Cst1 [Acidobacteriota bacterium]